MEGTTKSSAQDDPDPYPDPFPDTNIESTAAESQDGSAPSTDTPPSPQTAEAIAAVKKEKARVRFNSTAAANKPPTIIVPTSSALQEPEPREVPVIRPPRPSILRGSSYTSNTSGQDHDELMDERSEEAIQAALAQARANRVAEKVRRDSLTPSSRTSLESRPGTAMTDSSGPLLYENIPLQNLTQSQGTSEGGDSQTAVGADEGHEQLQREAFNLVRAHTQVIRGRATDEPAGESAVVDSTTIIPSEVHDGSYDGVYNVPVPQHYRGSVLSQLLKLYKPAEGGGMSSHKRHSSTGTGGSNSGATTPTRRKWYEQNRSQDTLANLIEASTRLANPNLPTASESPKLGPFDKKRHKRNGSSSRLSQYWQKEEARITVHIAETLARQDYIVKLCRALMLFGAPTHRLEEYLSMTARVLEIDGQFLYLPGCMIISFDDKSTHTTEVRIVRTAQGIDLGKLKDVHQIYKEVMHDVIGVEEGTKRLEERINAKDKFPAWFRVLIFGFTSAVAAPFSFKARFIDLPLCFFFGCLVGLLQLIVAPKSNLYNNVFEVSATVLVSFLARAFGSIKNGELFCFSSLAQGGIVMLLPGYAVLCSSLELQSRALVPGSIRIVYAIIYSLLLGFGITVGAALYGLFDSNATSATTCTDPMDSYLTFVFVPLFVVCICILYQAKWRQMPITIIISFAGYIVNYFSSIRFAASPQVSSTLGAFAVGVLANLYSRIRHGVAAAILIPAVFCQVPGGLASTGGLLSGLKTANMLTNSSQTVNSTSSVQISDGQSLNTVSFDVAASMIQIAIGIAVGLFISALVIYPFGKRRSGLFSF
ncbi:unnamed protein product [Clonostachys rosea f. rosea IK726]|nr:unnamed protein product [Clonostachys rosea f. rosea IK726]